MISAMVRLGTALLWIVLPVIAQQPDALLKEAISAHQSGDLDTAIRNYRAYLKIKPSSFEARSNLGAALARKGEYEAAVGEYEAALRDSPGNPGVQFNIGLAYYKMGDVRRAAAELNALRAATGGNPQTIMLLADCYLQLGENKKVIDLLKPVNDAGTSDLGVVYLLGS